MWDKFAEVAEACIAAKFNRSGAYDGIVTEMLCLAGIDAWNYIAHACSECLRNSVQYNQDTRWDELFVALVGEVPVPSTFKQRGQRFFRRWTKEK